MQVQFPVRWSDNRHPGIKGDDILKRLINGEELEESSQDENLNYVYGSVILDTKDVRAYNDLDDKHCILRSYQGDSYCIALSLDELKEVMTDLTGKQITIIRRIEKTSPDAGKAKPKKRKNDEDDLLM